MKTIILFLFSLGLVSAEPNGTIHGQPRMKECANMPSFMKNNDRIVGGQNAPSPIPWQVWLPGGCGATILDPTTLLSASHCSPQVGESIRAGSIKKGSGGQVKSIAQVIDNTDLPYNSQTFENDFVIIKLDSALILNNDVQPACLPPSKTYLGLADTEEQCFTSGWGVLQPGDSSTPDMLQYVQVPAISNAACNKAYNGLIKQSMICAGYPGEGGKDACQGDSGGPLVCNKDGKAIIAGVVSWGYSCALPEYPGVYARTTHVLDWIESQIETGGPTTPTPSCDDIWKSKKCNKMKKKGKCGKPKIDKKCKKTCGIC